MFVTSKCVLYREVFAIVFLYRVALVRVSIYCTRREPKFKTTANEAYNVMKEREEGGTGDGYETPHHHLDSVLSTSTDVIASIEDSTYEN